MSRSARIQERTGNRSAATERKRQATVCLLRGCGGHTTASELAGWLADLVVGGEGGVDVVKQRDTTRRSSRTTARATAAAGQVFSG